MANETENRFEKIESKLLEATENLKRIYTEIKIDSGNFDPSVKISDRNIAISEIIGFFEHIGDKLNIINHNLVYFYIPLNKIDNIANQTEQLEKQSLALFDNLSTEISQNGGATTFNGENFHIQMKNGQNKDFRPNFQKFSDIFDNFRDSLLPLYYFLHNNSETPSGEDFWSLRQSIKNILEMSTNTIAASETTEATAAKIESICQNLQKIHAEMNSIKDESSQDRQRVKEHLSESTEVMAKIRETSSENSLLQKTVEEYHDKFLHFDQNIENREKSWLETNEKLNSIKEEMTLFSKEIRETIEKSQDMLSSATVAGLSKHFYDIKESITDEMRGARILFYFGIIFLFLLSIPLMAYILAPILPIIGVDTTNITHIIGQNGTATGWQYLGQVVSRLIILLPAIWLLSFSLSRHRSLFKLREHYSYKYSMAVSVEGFKKQAPSYEDDIAAVVFEQLSYNPAEFMDKSSKPTDKRSNSPIFIKFLNRFLPDSEK